MRTTPPQRTTDSGTGCTPGPDASNTVHRLSSLKTNAGRLAAVAGTGVLAVWAIVMFVPGHQTAPGAAQETDSKAVVDAVRRLTSLPGDETPTVFTVGKSDDVTKSAFFRDARAGDKVLIYKRHDRAILYRPSENKIIRSRR